MADGLSLLSTGTLRIEDIKNRATYSASQVSVGGGFSFGGGGGESAGQGGVGQDKQGNVAAGGNAKPASSVPSDKSGLAMGLPVALSASGNASSTTRNGISEGVIEIRDEAGQQALTGKSAAETIASLNRDTTDTLGALKPIFDKEKIEAGFEIGTAFAGEMGQFLTNRAREVDALEKRAGDITLSDEQRMQAAIQAEDLAADWGPSGTYRRILNAVAAGVGGNVTGGAGQFVQVAAVNYLQGLAASEVKAIADALEDSPGKEPLRAALHAIVGCAGAVGSSASCGAGALGAGAGSIINSLLEPPPEGSGAEGQEARRNLVTSLVAGIAAATGVDPAAALSAAVAETENNYLKPEEFKEYAETLERWKACDTAVCRKTEQAEARKWQALSAQRNEAMWYGCMDNPAQCQADGQELKADIDALKAQAESLDRAAAKTAANNLAQAEKAYYTNLEVRAELAKRELEATGQGFWLASLSGEELAAKGVLTQQEAEDLNVLRRQMLGAAVVIPAGIGGATAKLPPSAANAQQVVQTVKAGVALSSSQHTRMIAGVTVVDNKSGKIFQGVVDVGPTLDRIKAGGGVPP